METSGKRKEERGRGRSRSVLLPMEAEERNVFNDWEIGKFLGKGLCGEVKEAKNKKDGKKVCESIFHPNFET